MSTLKNKMAGKLSGSMKSTEDRLAKAEAVMASGGLLKPPEVVQPSKADMKPVEKQLDFLDGELQQKTVKKTTQKKSTVVSVTPVVDESRVQRETFTMLPSESDLIDEVRTLAAANKLFTTRSAVVRAGILALHALKGEQLMNILKKVPVVKPGRK